MKFKNIEFTEDMIFKLLQSLGFTNITNHKNEFKFSWYEDSNPNGSCLFKDRLHFVYWSKDLSGDIIELIKSKLECSYRESFIYLENFSNEKIIYKKEIEKSAFQKYLEELRVLQNDDTYEIYDDRILMDYKNTISELFLKDGINTLTQYKFGLIYDDESSRIGIPIRDKDGHLVGVLGRFNYKHVTDGIAKYLPIIKYKRSLFLFGMYENRDQEKDVLYIVESEKSVLRAWSLGYRNVYALGTCRVSNQQRKLIETMNPKEVVLLLDEGLDDEFYVKIAEDLITKNPIFKYKVGYIKSNHIGLGYKDCIFDRDKEFIDRVLKNEINYIN